MEFVDFTLDYNGADCLVGSLANEIAVESLSQAKLFMNVMNVKFSFRKFSKLLELRLVLESGSVQGTLEWINWRWEKCLHRELPAVPPSLELFSRGLDFVIDVCKAPNPLVVS